MEVILRQYVEHLGKRGDIVKVAAGYARNYLLPRKLALPATDGNKRHVERERKIMEVKEADEKAQAQAVASRIEAIEVVIDAVNGDTDAVIRESADLLYNLVVLWAHAGVRPDDVWAEMRRRELLFGIAEKLPKKLVQAAPPRKVVAIESGRVRRPR